ncbi:MAG: SIMPL domain-containing protein [Bauldia sp.]
MKPMLAGLAAALLFALPAFADTPTPTLSANGQGTEMVVPDIATVSIGVVSRAKTASAALGQNSTDLARAIAAIQAAGVADKDIGTSGLSIDPVYQQPADGQAQTTLPAIIGYSVSNSVTVTIRDIAKSGGILDAVVSAGANQVNGISFDVSDPKAAHDASLKAAIADALARGQLMADAAGVKLVRVLSVSTSEGGMPRPVFAAMAFKAAPVPVMPGQQSLDASATVTWEIAPK